MGILRRLWQALGTLFAGRHRGAPAASEPPERQTVADYARLLERHGGTRVTTIRFLGRQATEDDVLFTRDHFETEDDLGNAIQVDAFTAPLCSFGHVLDQQVRPTARCELGGELMCSTEGCAAWCCVCGAACCAQHRSSYQLEGDRTVTYCSRCGWRHWWRRWWGLYQ